jgi:Ca-activated chloride channel homolog
MRKLFTFTLLCLVLATLASVASAQTRPRRVGSTPASQPQPQPVPQQPADQTSAPARPNAPPVLGGANRNPNEQKPVATPDAGPEEVAEGDVVRVETTLVSIPVSVMDRDGKFIPNLRKEDFHIWEDGTEQQVAYFASTEKPFTVALVIDTSGSTKYRLDEIQDAAIAFVEQLRPDDRVMIVSFNDKIKVLSQPTNDRNMLRDAIRRTEAGSGTRLYDAVDMIINEYFNRIEGRKAMVLFTDGVDTTSKRASYESTMRDAEELDALIYPVEYDTYAEMGGGGWPRGGGGGGNWPGGGGGGRRGGSRRGGGGGGGILDDIISILGGGNVNIGGGHGGGGRGGSGTSREEYETGDRYLHDLARVSGARLYNAEQQNVSYAFQSVAEELRRQYSLGYYPKNKPTPGERRNIRVRVDRPELVVRTRDSYVFQPGANAAQNNSQPKAPVLKKEFAAAKPPSR